MFLLGLALWFVAAAIPGFSFRAAQLRYVRLVRAHGRRDVGIPGEDGVDWLAIGPGMSWRLWTIVWEEQADPELEAARLRVVARWKACVIVAFGGGLLPIIFSYL